MTSGLLRPRYDKRDFDFHKSFGSTLPVQFPAEYNVDAGLWLPNQNSTNAPTGLDVIPPLPYGCTDYTQTDLCIDEDGHLLDPMRMENETHANTLGGLDIRISLKAAIRIFQRTAYFNIRASAPLDMFDAIRLAMLSTKDEKRAVSAGTPFFPEWSGQEILPIPVFDLREASWHNWKIAGWKMIGDQPYLICKMWTGDWKYMSRPLCNAVFGISGSVAYTLSKIAPAQVQTIDFNFVQWVVSFFRSLFTPPQPVIAPQEPPTAEPAPKPTQPTPVPPEPVETVRSWDTPEQVRHNIRVMCDEAGLAFQSKNILTACIYQESRFNPKAVGKPNFDGSRDWGLCQYNDNPKNGWIGAGCAFASTDEALNDPEKNVRVMIDMWKLGKPALWASFKFGAYKQWLDLVQHPILST